MWLEGARWVSAGLGTPRTPNRRSCQLLADRAPPHSERPTMGGRRSSSARIAAFDYGKPETQPPSTTAIADVLRLVRA